MNTLDEFDGSPARETTSRRTCNSFQGDLCMALYLRDLGPVKRLSSREEAELAARIQKGDPEARDQMIKANLPLVVKIAKDYDGIGVPLLDLISEGNIGLMRAVERFDPSKGAKFSAYGALWIKQAITKALASQSKAIRLPTHVIDKLRKIQQAMSCLARTLGREPTDEELAAEVGTTSRRLTQMRIASIRPASLDAGIDGEGTDSYAETVADEKAQSPYEKLESEARKAMLHTILQTLDEREQVILRLRFGFDGDSPKTLDEIGKELGVSSERVRQLQKTALEKLRRRINNLEYTLPLSRSRAPQTVPALSVRQTEALFGNRRKIGRPKKRTLPLYHCEPNSDQAMEVLGCDAIRKTRSEESYANFDYEPETILGAAQAATLASNSRALNQDNNTEAL